MAALVPTMYLRTLPKTAAGLKSGLIVMSYLLLGREFGVRQL